MQMWQIYIGKTEEQKQKAHDMKEGPMLFMKCQECAEDETKIQQPGPWRGGRVTHSSGPPVGISIVVLHLWGMPVGPPVSTDCATAARNCVKANSSIL